MNDLKTDQRNKVIEYISIQLQKLYFAYDQDIDIEKFNKTLKIIISELEEKNQLTQSNIDDTYKEILTNFTIYRKFNVSCYMTALSKVQDKFRVPR